ncbi:MAG: transpeptidase family protein [Cyclobacteriaceae bacterium]|nr:transpeptidase family protein [Cyclobacteriaceae bacterium]
MNIKNSILLRVRLAFLFMLVFSVGIIYRIVVLQHVEGEEWVALADQITYKVRKVNATRGNIYSDNGSLLATSLPFYKVAFDPDIPSEKLYKSGLDTLSLLLSRFYKDHNKNWYKQKINDARIAKKRYLILNRKQINYQEKKEMSGWPIFKEGRLKGGVIFEKVDKRFRPFSNLSYRTIGYINEEEDGVVGLEFSFNKQLSGNDGEALYQKMAGGNWKPIYDGSEVRTEDGWDIQTTLDVNLQDVTESALLRSLEDHQADYGTAVVMEVATGEIKAMSSLSRNKNGSYFERYNYAVGRQGLTEPGSTFKLATMIALLEETNINLSDSIDTGNGEYKFYDNTVRDHHEGGYGTISIKQAFEQSSNIAMAKLVDKHFGLKPEKFLQYVDDLKLSQPLGFQLFGEGSPKIKRPSDKEWSGITLPWMAYGYGLELTPLQMLALYNAVANDGKMIRPIIVKSANKADQVKENYETVVLNNKICSEETLSKIRLMLEGVVERGTAVNIKNKHYSIAGKTGTSQILENGRYTRKYITSFAGYFPADNPKYSAIVLIKNPKGWRQYGSNVAAPVFKEVADNIYARDIQMHDAISRDVEPQYGFFPVVQAGNRHDLTLICNELGVSNHSSVEDNWVRAGIKANSLQWKATYDQENFVPNVLGMTLRDALFLLEKHGLQVKYEGFGRVKNQSLSVGKKINKGERIVIELS